MVFAGAEGIEVVDSKDIPFLRVPKLLLAYSEGDLGANLIRLNRAGLEYPVHVAVGEVVDGRASLLKEGPEQHAEEHQNQHDEEALTLNLRAANGFKSQVPDRQEANDQEHQSGRSRDFVQQCADEDAEGRAVIGEALDEFAGHNLYINVGPDQAGKQRNDQDGADVDGDLESLEKDGVRRSSIFWLQTFFAHRNEGHNASNEQAHGHKCVDQQEQHRGLHQDHRRAGDQRPSEDHEARNP